MIFSSNQISNRTAIDNLLYITIYSCTLHINVSNGTKSIINNQNTIISTARWKKQRSLPVAQQCLHAICFLKCFLSSLLVSYKICGFFSKKKKKQSRKKENNWNPFWEIVIYAYLLEASLRIQLLARKRSNCCYLFQNLNRLRWWAREKRHDAANECSKFKLWILSFRCWLFTQRTLCESKRERKKHNNKWLHQYLIKK